MRAYVWNPPNPAYALPQTHDIARFDAGQRGSVGKTVEYALHRYHAKLRLIEAKQFAGERIAQGLAARPHRKLRYRREPGIGRESCRGRRCRHGETSVVGGSRQRKKIKHKTK